MTIISPKTAKGMLCSALIAFSAVSVLAAERIFIVGDSTVASYESKHRPVSGWGEQLQLYFDDQVVIDNRANSGESSKTFLESKIWKALLKDVKKGDYVLVQLGHNDQWQTPKFSHPDTTYKENLKRLVSEARAAGANPVLVTPVERSDKWTRDGTFRSSHFMNDWPDQPKAILTYPEAMREVALATKTPCIDLQARSQEVLIKRGREKSDELYMVFPEGKYPNYPKGKKDREHLSEKGAKIFAGLVAAEFIRIKLPQAVHVKAKAGSEQ